MNSHTKTSQAGFSLVEVLIAVVILGFAGMALLTGLRSSQEGAAAVDRKANAMVALTAAAEEIAGEGFPGCTGSMPFSSNPKLTALKVEVRQALFYVTSSTTSSHIGAWVDHSACAGDTVSEVKVQIATIGSATTATGKSKWLTKLAPKSGSQFSVTVSPASPVSVPRNPGFVDVTVSTTFPLDHKKMSFYFTGVTAADKAQIDWSQTSVPTTTNGTSVLHIVLASGAAPGSYQFEVGGTDLSQSDNFNAQPTTLTLAIQ